MKRGPSLTKRRFLTVAFVIATVGAGALISLTRGPPPLTPRSTESFSFAALGDAPYYWFEDLQYRVVLEDIAAHDLSFALHVGDILDSACTDERYRRTLDEFNAIPHPVIYTPGDNEWTDCWSQGDFDPLVRLQRLRELFFDDPSTSLGGERLPLQHQGLDDRFVEFPENARWTHEGVVFATMHLVGSGNGSLDTPGNSDAGRAESVRRLRAAVAWLRDTFAAVRSSGAAAVVIAFHANPQFEDSEAIEREAFDPFMAALEEETALFGSPVLAIHGDWHAYTVDQPLRSRVTNAHLGNLTRLQVPGSFDVGWVRVTFTPGAEQPFGFEPRVVPPWKYW